MSKFGWGATLVCVGMSYILYQLAPEFVYHTGEPATFLRLGIISMPLWPLLMIYKWEWEAYQERKGND